MNSEDLKHRFAFHPAPDAEKQLEHGSVRQGCTELALLLNGLVPEGREKALAFTHLEEVMFWATAGIAREGGWNPS